MSLTDYLIRSQNTSDMDSTDRNIQQPERKRAFRKGFMFGAVLTFLLCGLYQCTQYYRQHLKSINIHRTEPSRKDVGTLSALLSMPPDSGFQITKFGFWFAFGMGDANGNWVAAIRRTSNSPSWEEMLSKWQLVEDSIYGDEVSQATTVAWFNELLDNYKPQDAIYEKSQKYRRRVNVHRSYVIEESNARVLNWTMGCEAFFLPNDPDTLYLCGDGYMLLDDSVIDFE